LLKDQAWLANQMKPIAAKVKGLCGFDPLNTLWHPAGTQQAMGKVGYW